MATARQDHCTDIDGIAFAVFAKFGIGNAVTTPAVVRTEAFDAAQRVPKLDGVTGSLVADPGSEGFRHRAAQHCGRPDLDALAVGHQYGFQPDHIAAAALARTDKPRQ